MELNQDFWDQIKAKMKARNRDNTLIESWINPIAYIETVIEDGHQRMVLGVPSMFHKYYVIESLLESIYAEISHEFQGPFSIEIQVNKQTNQDSAQFELTDQTFGGTEDERLQHQASLTPLSAPTAPVKKSNAFDFLNPHYTFSSYVVGRNSEFAHAACYNVARNPGEGYNPLLICGPTGMGKTHLLHAVGHEIRNSFPHLKVMYIQTERFLTDFVTAIRTRKMEEFRLKFRESFDILMVDDIQFLSKGEQTQEEFFHMVNSFMDSKKQIILASDRMPKDILKLDDRNRSRLEWGLIVDIQMPDFETRVAILRYKAERLQMKLAEDVIEYIARISKRSIRELEGNLKKVKMFSELQGLPVDYSLARKVLTTHETQSTMTIEDIQKMVADHYKVRIADLKSTSRAKQIVVPRQISMFLIKRHLDKPFVEIGRAFGDRDHTTVMSAIQRVHDLQEQNLEIKNDLEELTNRIHNITGV